MKHKYSNGIIIAMLCMVMIFSEAPMYVNAAYNANNAVKYARTYALKRNPFYPAFTSNCTNYVSQCAYAGGIKMKAPSKIKYNNDVNKCKKYWYFKKNSKGKYSYSSTWSVVAKSDKDSWWGFYNYMKSNGAKTYEYGVKTETQVNAFIAGCEVGDVIQVRKAGKKTKSHSCIVTEKTYDSKKKQFDMKICYNTSDVKDESFRNKWLAFGTDVTWTVIKLRTVNY